MATFLDLTGHRYNRLTVVGPLLRRNGRPYWPCRCDCGQTTVVSTANLRSSQVKSCGCYRVEVSSALGKALVRVKKPPKPPEYQVWTSMKRRCADPRLKQYADYGGRGIEVCERWRASFAAFMEDMGPRPSSKHQIDRINNNGNYEPNNCRWATSSENCNNKRNNRVLTHNDAALTVTQWSARTGISISAIIHRLDTLGWSVERTLTTPTQRRPLGNRTVVEHDGRALTLVEWSRETGLKPHTIGARIERGWSPSRAVSTPVEARYLRAA